MDTTQTTAMTTTATLTINGSKYDVTESAVAAAPVDFDRDGAEQWYRAVIGAACPTCLADHGNACSRPDGEQADKTHRPRIARAKKQGRIA